MISEFCKILNVHEEDVLGLSRQQFTSTTRQLYWKLLYHNDFTHTQIAALCGRTASTVLMGIRHVEEIIDVEPEFREMWEKIKHIKRNV